MSLGPDSLYPILACGTGRMMQARRANILNFDDGKDSHNINTKYYLWGKFHIECACHSISYCPNQHTQTMRAPTIVLGLFRIGAYLLTPASSFQAHHHHPSAAAASVLWDGGAIITGTKSKGASAPSNRDDEEVDHPDDDGRAAALAGGTTTSRRSFAEDAMAKASIFLGSSLLVACQQPTSPAHASGGATAGGAYLLSGTSGSDRLPHLSMMNARNNPILPLLLPAKQRYNKRVLAGIKSFLTLDAR